MNSSRWPIGATSCYSTYRYFLVSTLIWDLSRNLTATSWFHVIQNLLCQHYANDLFALVTVSYVSHQLPNMKNWFKKCDKVSFQQSNSHSHREIFCQNEETRSFFEHANWSGLLNLSIFCLLLKSGCFKTVFLLFDRTLGIAKIFDIIILKPLSWTMLEIRHLFIRIVLQTNPLCHFSLNFLIWTSMLQSFDVPSSIQRFKKWEFSFTLKDT